jgi:hypothetical protein
LDSRIADKCRRGLMGRGIWGYILPLPNPEIRKEKRKKKRKKERKKERKERIFIISFEKS